jgi:hypothetical protein
MTRTRARAARVLVLAALSLGHPSLARIARAQTAELTDPSVLQLRNATFAWDQELLRAGYSFNDVMDAEVKRKLSNGTANIIAMRVAVYREGERTPTLLIAQTCKVTKDLWEDVFKVEITTREGVSSKAAVNLAAVERLCGRVQDFPIAPRATLRAGVRHFLAVIVDVNPVSDEIRAQLRQWMQLPLGSADVGGGTALFSGALMLVFHDTGASDKTVQFRTQTFTP